MRRDITWIIGIIVIVLIFSYFVYPTNYYYGTDGTESTSKQIVKINRWTGDSFILMPDGWHKMQKKK